MPIVDVVELLRAVQITPLPGAPDVIEGVVDVRGDVLPVLDVRRRLGLPTRELRPSDHFVRVDAGGGQLLLRVDQVIGTQTLHGNPEPVAEIGPGSDHIAGVARHGSGVTVVYDVREFVSPDDARRVEAAVRRESTP